MSLLTPAPLQLGQVLLAALHMGALHSHERLLVLLVAFGPFVVLVAVVFLLRRRDIAAEAHEAHEAHETHEAHEPGEARRNAHRDGRPRVYERPEGS
jgi:hypothetical protein